MNILKRKVNNVKKYIPLKETTEKTAYKANFIRVELYYDKGGYDYMSYRQKPRGFYLSVTPVFKENKGTYTTEMFGAFRGYKQLILEVNRFSDKQYNKAVDLSKSFESLMVNRILKENNLTLAD